MSATRFPYHCLAAGLSVALIACDDVGGPTGWALERASFVGMRVTTLDGAPLANPISPSDAVAIVVTSGGSSSCTRPGPVSIDTLLNQIRLQVRDWVRTTAVACTRDVRPYARRLLHTFFEPGLWVVRVAGQSDTSVRVTVGAGDAGGWQSGPARGVGLVATTLDGRPVPALVPSATPIAITVTSAGSSTCSRPGPVTTTAQGTALSFDVADWERFVADPFACTADLRPLPRTMLHTLLVPGTHSIRAVGAEREIVLEIVVGPTEN